MIIRFMLAPDPRTFAAMWTSHWRNGVSVLSEWILGFAAALAVCSAVVAQTPTPAQAIALEQQGKLAEAALAWQAVVKANPRDASAFASLGVVFSKQEKYKNAADAYRKALSLNPKLPGIRINLGLAEFKQGNFKQAILPLTAVVRAEPQNQQARTLLGFSYYGAGKFAEASRELTPLAAADPSNTALHYTLAQSCLWAKQHDCATREFRSLLANNPDSAAVHMLMAQALDGTGKTDEAIAEFQAAARVSPREPNVHFGLGYLYWKLQQYDDARREFEAELANDAGHAQSLTYLGDIELKQNNPAGAIAFLEKAVRIRSDIRLAYLDLGSAFQQQKRFPEALKALQRAVQLDPAQPDAHYRLSRVYEALGRSADAQRELARTRELRQQADEDLVRKMATKPAPLHQPEDSHPQQQ